MFDDVVAVLRRTAQDDELAGVWLDDGRSAALPNGSPSRTAPLLSKVPGEVLFMRGAAAEPIRSPQAVRDELFTCEGVFLTGPRSAVLVCTEPPGEQRLGRRVTLRALGVRAE